MKLTQLAGLVTLVGTAVLAASVRAQPSVEESCRLKPLCEPPQWAQRSRSLPYGGEPDVLATVRIPLGGLADGKPLSAGTYLLRLTAERPTPGVGQSAGAQRVVEFVLNDTVVAREIAEVLHDSDLTPVGDSARRVRDGVRVEWLRGGEFLRVSVKRGTERYLIHLPAAGGRTP